jgi:hypothetical protein
LILTSLTTVQNLARSAFCAYGYRRFISEHISLVDVQDNRQAELDRFRARGWSFSSSDALLSLLLNGFVSYACSAEG